MDGQLAQWHAVFGEISHRSHLSASDELARLVADAAARVGIVVELYLADRRQLQLSPMSPGGQPLGIDSSLAGRAFQRVELCDTVDATGRPVLWLPLLDGTERLGVMQVVLPSGADPRSRWWRQQCWWLAGFVGHLVISKLEYGDALHRLRHTRPLSVASELLWQLLPPQTFACQQLVVTAVMEPYHEVGGDGYDYAVDGGLARLAVYDAVGHDLDAGLACALALAATRNVRRRGGDLPAMAAVADETIRDRRHGARFVTAVLAELDLTSGELRYVNAGHPPPLLLRAGRAVKALGGPVRPPLGLGQLGREPTRTVSEHLEPGDRLLLYTDGFTEARGEDGSYFGLDRLVDLVERHADAGLPAPETLRRLSHAVLEHQHRRLQDDATMLLVEWTATAAPKLLPSV